MPGPAGLGGSRYRHLPLDVDSSFSQPNKKHKSNITPTPLYTYPELPTSTNTKNPKFIVISPKSNEKPISSLNPFLLKKSIDNISKEYDQISQLRDGNLLVLVKTEKIAETFLKVDNLAKTCPVIVKLHDKLNESKGIAYAPCLINTPKDIILEEMECQGVKDVYKFTKNVDGKQRETGLILFTFNLYYTPKTVDIGFFKAKVTEYIPNPMRCRSCQLLGHTSKRCTGEAKCDICSLPPHTPQPCTKTMCANCSQAHSSSSKTCPAYKEAKEILTIKTHKKCTMAEAKKIHREQNNIPAHFSSSSELFSEKTKQNADDSAAQILNKESEQNSHKSNQTNTAKSTLNSESTKTNSTNSTIHNLAINIPQNTIISTTSNDYHPTSPKLNNHKKPDLNLTQEPKISDPTPLSDFSKISETNPNNSITTQPDSSEKSKTHTSNKQSQSPISKVTQALLEKHKYYVENPDPQDVDML
ncbi:uncharacterized protein LOC129911320 [Episyrphus balteatus]|uniref:uncharacterized protein LOC129911320 n=1 Tax=Episyrphus balteatus TaxID=286459 RepID=UPI0024854374|nr:uncharacterized protein LOC129911320 [Episyrphus balteatus]